MAIKIPKLAELEAFFEFFLKEAINKGFIDASYLDEVRVTKIFDTQENGYPDTCQCGHPAKVGFARTECTNKQCVHFSSST